MGASALATSLLASQAFAQVVPAPHANQYGLGMIGAPAAWAAGYNGAGVIVAVADSGIDVTHAAFAGRIDNRSRSFVLTTVGAAYDPGAIDDKNAESHGTHVAGIVGSSAASGAPGAAYASNLVVLRIFGACATGQNCDAPDIPNASVAAIDHFTGLADVRIYNASYGPNSGKDQTIWANTTIDADEQASILRAITAGKIIVAATGNDRATNPIAGVNPNGIALYPFIVPANANAGVYADGGRNFNFAALSQQTGLIIAATSVGQAKVIAPYAQTCGVTASWCVAAPGGDQAADEGIWSTLPPGTFGYQQGTSMATPMVSGALAVLQQAYPTYGARDLAAVLFATAENVGGRPAVNATYGYGLIRLDRAVAGPTALAAGADAAVAAGQTAYWSQPLTTGGAFTKSGPGFLIIAGRTIAMGDVSVNAGALGVDGFLSLRTQMTVAQGARLTGFGRIVGNTTIAGALNAGQLPNYADLMANNGGVLPPGIPLTGTSPGTLVFEGNVTLTGTATTRANIDGLLQVPGGPGTHDKIFVLGAGATFTAGGTLAPVLRDIPGGNNNFSPAIGTTIAFVRALDGAAVAGQFASLAQPGAGLAANSRLDVVYSTTAITFNVTPLDLSALAANEGRNQNVQAVANALDAVRPPPGNGPRGAVKTVFDDLYDASEDEIEAELETLAGEGQASAAVAGLATFAAFSSEIADHQSAAGLNADGWSFWAQGFGPSSRVRDDDDGFFGADAETTGGLTGADRELGPNLRGGLALGVARTKVDAYLLLTTFTDHALAAYATWTPGAWTLDTRLVAGHTTGDTERAIVIGGVAYAVEGSSKAWGASLAGQVSYRFDLGGLAVSPYAALTAQVSHREAFTESSDFGLELPSQTFSRVSAGAGLRATAEFEVAGFTVSPSLRLGYARDMGDRGLVTEVALFDSPFELDAADPGRNVGLVGLELNAGRPDGFTAFLGYAGEFRDNATVQEARVGFRVRM